MIELYRYLQAMLILKMISWAEPPHEYAMPPHLRYTIARWLIGRYILLICLPIESPVYDKWRPIIDAIRSDELDRDSFNLLTVAFRSAGMFPFVNMTILQRGYFETMVIHEATGDFWIIGNCIKGPCKQGERLDRYRRLMTDVIGDIVHEDARRSQELYNVYRIECANDGDMKRAKHLIEQERSKKKTRKKK